jgi:hypothetical protein
LTMCPRQSAGVKDIGTSSALCVSRQRIAVTFREREPP